MKRIAPTPLFAVALSLSLAPATASALDLDGDSFHHRKLGLSFAVPSGWSLSRQTGYPSLIAILTRPGASLSVATARRRKVRGRRQSVQQLLQRNARALAAVKITLVGTTRRVRVGKQLWELTARTRDGRTAISQYYLAADDVVFILTLSASPGGTRKLLGDVDYLLETFDLKRAKTIPRRRGSVSHARSSSRPSTAPTSSSRPTTAPASGFDSGPLPPAR